MYRDILFVYYISVTHLVVPLMPLNMNFLGLWVDNIQHITCVFKAASEIL